MFFLSLTLDTCDQKRAVILRASISSAPAGQSSCDPSGGGAQPLPAHGRSARLFPAPRGHWRSAFGCFRSHSRRAAEALSARLQMSDPRAAEGLGCWSPEARRQKAGGVGDGPGVEGSQAAASGTQGWGAGTPAARPQDPAPWRRARRRSAPRSPAERPRLGISFARRTPVFALALTPYPGPRPPPPPPCPYPRPWFTLDVIFYFCFEMPWFLPRFLSQISPDGTDRAALPLAPLQLQRARGSTLRCAPQPNWPRCPQL